MIVDIVDIVIHLLVGVLNVVVAYNCGVLWILVLIISDILVIIGVMQNNTGLIIAWMIIRVVNIGFMVIELIAWSIIYEHLRGSGTDYDRIKIYNNYL